MKAEDFMTVKEVAAMFRLVPDVIRKNVASGKIKSIKVGGTIRIPRSQFDMPIDAIEKSE